MDEDEIKPNQTESAPATPVKPAKKPKAKPTKRGGARAGAGRKKKPGGGPSGAPAAPAAPAVQAEIPADSTAPAQEPPRTAPASSSTPPQGSLDDLFGAPPPDKYADLRRKIALNTPEVEPYVTGLVAPVLCALIATHTGCDLSTTTVRGKTIARSGQVVGRSMSGLEALSLGLSQLAAAAVPSELDEHFKHPLAPAGMCLAGVGGAVAMSLICKRLGVTDDQLKDLLREAAKQGAKADAKAHAAAAPSSIPSDDAEQVFYEPPPARPSHVDVVPASEAAQLFARPSTELVPVLH